MMGYTLTIDEGTRVRTLSEAEVSSLLDGEVGASLRCAISGAMIVASIAFIVKVGGRNVVVSRTHVREAEDRHGEMAETFALVAVNAIWGG